MEGSVEHLRRGDTLVVIEVQHDSEQVLRLYAILHVLSQHAPRDEKVNELRVALVRAHQRLFVRDSVAFVREQSNSGQRKKEEP